MKIRVSAEPKDEARKKELIAKLLRQNLPSPGSELRPICVFPCWRGCNPGG